MNSQTIDEYKDVISTCKDVFIKKTKDYGTAWRILRLPSLTDQIFIKAQRIRSIQEKGSQKVSDDIKSEFLGIINYCIIALIQLDIGEGKDLNLKLEDVDTLYDKQVETTMQLLESKNHDYDEAWREMRVSSITDIILMKIFRVKQIENNQGSTIISEGVDANYQDMINYAVFCLIMMSYEEN